MAYIKARAILTRCREVLESSAGVLRTVPASRFTGDLPEGLGDDEDMRRAMATPRIEASIQSMERSAASPPVIGSYAIFDLTILIRIVRTITPLEQLDDASRTALQALADEDVDVVSQALGYPNNMQQTAAGTACDLVSNVLLHRSSKVIVKKAIDGAQPLETQHLFLGRAISRPATS